MGSMTSFAVGNRVVELSLLGVCECFVAIWKSHD